MRLTDGRTDRNLIARPRLHSMQRGKNHTVLSFMKLPKRKIMLLVEMFVVNGGPVKSHYFISGTSSSAFAEIRCEVG